MRLEYDLRPRRTPPPLGPTLVLLGLGLTAVSCDTGTGGTACTLDMRTGARGTIRDAEGQPLVPDAVEVRVNGGASMPCEVPDARRAQDASADQVTYSCWEQGAGSYEVTVTVGNQVQKQSAEVEADACHVTGPAELDFVFDLAECDSAGDCEIYVEACCSCGPPTLEDALARRRDDDNLSGRPAECEGVACGACAQPPATVPHVVPACLEGVCEPVDIREQPYAECEQDSDCQLIAASCCGHCGAATVDDSLAIRADAGDDYDVCDWEGGVPCPDIACPEEAPEAEAYCHADGHCDVRAL